jgi:hypothetical protein
VADRWHFQYFDPLDQPKVLTESLMNYFHDAVSTVRPNGHPVINITGNGYACVKPDLYNAMSDIFSTADKHIPKAIMDLDEDPWASGYHILRIVEHQILWTNQYSYMRQFGVTCKLFIYCCF